MWQTQGVTQQLRVQVCVISVVSISDSCRFGQRGGTSELSETASCAGGGFQVVRHTRITRLGGMGWDGMGRCRMGIRQLQRLNNLQTENIFENDVLLVTEGKGGRGAAACCTLPPVVFSQLHFDTCRFRQL